MPHSRTRLQQKLALITAVKQHQDYVITRIFSVAGIGYCHKELFNWLLENDLIKPNEQKGFICTAMGNEMLEVWKKLCENMGENPNVM